MEGTIKLHPSWAEPLSGEFASLYMSDLKEFLLAEREAGKRIFPKGCNWFRALDLTPLDELRLACGRDVRPVLAPAMGQGLLFVGTWRLMFDLLLVAGIIVALWAGLRLPETMRALGAQPLPLATSARRALETPQTIGYGVSGGLMFGCVLGYVSSAQQVFVDAFGLGALFPLAFGTTALMIALASLTNAMLVERLGMRRLSHTALAAFIVLSAVLAAAALLGAMTFWLFIGLMVPLFYLFGLIAPNFNAMAMEPQGDNAGMASSVIGFVSTGIGALAGGVVGHLFDGTVLPLALGFFGLSCLCFALVIWIEGPRGIFRPGR